MRSQISQTGLLDIARLTRRRRERDNDLPALGNPVYGGGAAMLARRILRASLRQR